MKHSQAFNEVACKVKVKYMQHSHFEEFQFWETSYFVFAQKEA